jgi:malonyl CoA-acyl carrier protein transacylase
MCEPTRELRDIAYHCNTGLRARGRHRVAIVASSVTEAASRIHIALQELSKPDCRSMRGRRGVYFFDMPPAEKGKVAFLFPGDGAQYPGMLADVCLYFPKVRAWFDRLDRTFQNHGGAGPPSSILFGSNAPDSDALQQLWSASAVGETVFTASQALLELLTGLGVRPDAVAGHCGGDFSALLASGAMGIKNDEELIGQARVLNAIFGATPELVSLAVNTDDQVLVETAIQASGGELRRTIENCPHQSIICGPAAAVDRAMKWLRDAGALCELMPFRRAYHTPMCADVSRRVFDFFETVEVVPPAIPVYSCATAQPYPTDPGELRGVAAGLWSRPVRFTETVRAMYGAGVTVFVEVGPNGTLTGFVKDTLRDCRSAFAVASNLAARPGMVQLQHLVAQLFAAGIDLKLDSFYEGREPSNASTEPRDSTTLELRLPGLRLGKASDPPQIPEIPKSLEPAAADTRAQVLQNYFRSMDTFLNVERDVMIACNAGRRPPGASASAPGLPFMRRLISLVPGRSARIECDLDLDEDLFLRDHTLSGAISITDPSLVGLPVVPLTITMEMLAEAAATLCPGKIVAGMKDVQAVRWLTLDENRLCLEITAETGASADEVHVTLKEAGLPNHLRPAAQSTVLLADGYAAGALAEPLRIQREHPSKWRSGKIYERSGMFHGPLFQVIDSIERTGSDGAEAVFTGKSSRGFFRTRDADRFIIDPVVLDAMGQLIGCWTADEYHAGLSVFPFRLSRLDLYRNLIHAGETVRCMARIHEIDDHWISSSVDVVTGDGCYAIRMHRWEDRRLDLPRRLYDFRISPLEVMLSDDVRPILGRSGEHAWPVILQPIGADLLQAAGEIWLRSIAYMVLNRAERAAWRPLRSRDWLAVRIAVKDAMRLLLQERDNLRLCPADIEVKQTADNLYEMTGHGAAEIRNAPVAAVRVANGAVLAVASENAGWAKTQNWEAAFSPSALAADRAARIRNDDHNRRIDHRAGSARDPDRVEGPLGSMSRRDSVPKS